MGMLWSFTIENVSIISESFCVVKPDVVDFSSPSVFISSCHDHIVCFGALEASTQQIPQVLWCHCIRCMVLGQIVSEY